jgi:hypothetical protein
MNKNKAASAFDELKNEAYLIFAEWGPDLMIPREKRLADCFPQLLDEVRAAWLDEFKRIHQAIWQVAEQGAQRHSTLDAFDTHMRMDFPFMNEAALSKAWTLANYYAWHEGYL